MRPKHMGIGYDDDVKKKLSKLVDEKDEKSMGFIVLLLPLYQHGLPRQTVSELRKTQRWSVEKSKKRDEYIRAEESVAKKSGKALFGLPRVLDLRGLQVRVPKNLENKNAEESDVSTPELEHSVESAVDLVKLDIFQD